MCGVVYIYIYIYICIYSYIYIYIYIRYIKPLLATGFDGLLCRNGKVARSEEAPLAEVAAASLVPKLSRADYYSNPSIDSWIVRGGSNLPIELQVFLCTPCCMAWDKIESHSVIAASPCGTET